MDAFGQHSSPEEMVPEIEAVAFAVSITGNFFNRAETFFSADKCSSSVDHEKGVVLGFEVTSQRFGFAAGLSHHFYAVLTNI